MARLTNKERGEKNSQKLLAYISSTPLKDIPRNQYGSASQFKILTSLQIPTSNRNSSLIENQFIKLNKKLSKTTKDLTHHSTEEVRNLQNTVSVLQKRLIALEAENDLLKMRLKTEDWFLETGCIVRR